MKILETDEVLEIPVDIAVCPICGGKLYAQFDNWFEKNGQWKAQDVNIDCENEPDIDSDEWKDWHSGHYSMPYVDWLPVLHLVIDWVNKNYSFNLCRPDGSGV